MSSGAKTHCRQVGAWVASAELQNRKLYPSPGNPFGLAMAAVAHGIEHQFDPARNSQLVEDAIEIFLYRVLAQAEFAGNIAIGQSIGHQGDDLLLARGEQFGVLGIHHAQRGHLGHNFQQVLQLLAVGPDLSLVHALDTAAQQAKRIRGKTEQAFRAGAESIGYDLAIVGFKENIFAILGFARCRRRTTDIFSQLSRGWSAFRRRPERAMIQRWRGSRQCPCRKSRSEIGTAAEGVDQKLALHLIGIGDKYANGAG